MSSGLGKRSVIELRDVALDDASEVDGDDVGPALSGSVAGGDRHDGGVALLDAAPGNGEIAKPDPGAERVAELPADFAPAPERGLPDAPGDATDLIEVPAETGDFDGPLAGEPVASPIAETLLSDNSVSVAPTLPTDGGAANDALLLPMAEPPVATVSEAALGGSWGHEATISGSGIEPPDEGQLAALLDAPGDPDDVPGGGVVPLLPDAVAAFEAPAIHPIAAPTTTSKAWSEPAEAPAAVPLLRPDGEPDVSQRFRRLAWTGLRYGGYAAAIWLGLTILSIVSYRFIDPPFSNLMAFQWISGQPVTRTWTPVERMSPNLVRAVVASEDGRFCQHFGLDLKEIEAAFERSRDGTPRGASTISMQVVKNLYLWPSKSYIRKVLEVPLTFFIELVWPKWRIFEVYANIAEWGPGVFGAEAAARHHFGKAASSLTAREASLLAVSLPNPIVRNAGSPGPGTARLSRIIQQRMRHVDGAVACIESRRKGIAAWRTSVRPSK